MNSDAVGALRRVAVGTYVVSLSYGDDEGLDGVIRQDTLGLDRINAQAKRYAADRPIGPPNRVLGVYVRAS